MKKLSELPSPVLAGVIREKEERAAIAGIANCRYHGAAMIDLHLSCLENREEASLRRIIGAARLPVLALNYNAHADWSGCGFTEEERTALLLRAVEAGAAGVDMQGYTFDARSKQGFFGEDKFSFTRGNPKEIVTDEAVIGKQCEMIDRVHRMGAEVLLSCHPGIAMNAEQVVELALYLEKRGPDIIKIVTIANNEAEMLESLRAMMLLRREVRTPVSYHAGGEAGALSRILNPLLGGHIVFCVDGYNEYSTMAQIDLQTARDALDALRKIGGVQ